MHQEICCKVIVAMSTTP